MIKQRNEKYNPDHSSNIQLTNLKFRLANSEQIDQLVELMYYRNPGLDKDFLHDKTNREIQKYSNGNEYGLSLIHI